VQAQQTSLVSVNSAGTNGGNGDSNILGAWAGRTISDDGRLIVFESVATDLVPNLPNNFPSQVYVRDLKTKTTSLVSVNRLGTAPGNGPSGQPNISADGRFVSFSSWASNLVPSDTNQGMDVFVRDLKTGTTTLASVNLAGTDSGRDPQLSPGPYSFGPQLSADGGVVIFYSYASDLVIGDTNHNLDLFARDLRASATEAINVNDAGLTTGNLTPLTFNGVYDFEPTLSANGRFVAFVSYSNDLVENDKVCAGTCDGTNGLNDVFVRDLVLNKTILASVNVARTNSGNRGAYVPAINADGRVVAFRSFSTDLVTLAYDSPQADIYVRDMSKAETTMVSVNQAGTGSSKYSGGVNAFQPRVSGDGRFVAFGSPAPDLVTNKNDVLSFDVFVRDLLKSETKFVSVNLKGNDNGRPLNTSSWPLALSYDGRFIVFESNANDLAPNDANNDWDIFARDTVKGTTALVSINSAGTASGGGYSQDGYVSTDGRVSVFESKAADLVTGDTNGAVDIFARPLFKGNPIDDTHFFVTQHYRDFLLRDPDVAGLDFWVNQIDSCADLHCAEARRINVSAAFFQSIEFSQTGYLVERFYKVAYGDAIGISSLNGTHELAVPIVRLDEFLSDTQRLGHAVIVLKPDWEKQLESNKQAYAADFVQTSRFVTALPTTMTPTQFVDKLNQNAGHVLSPSERTTLINLFGGASDTTNITARAQVVRQVADDADLFNAEFNRAFVLTEYLGYLRRNPNDAPEPTLDYTGYDFWLTKLNQFGGNYIDAEMVKAFLSSNEYRQRFAN
jgi:Tol biopolymer transport system component